MLAFQQLWRAAGVFDDFDAAADLAERVVEHFAVFFGNGAGNLARVVFQQLLVAKQDARALGRRLVTPARECRARGPDRLPNVRRARQRHPADDAPRRLVGDLGGAVGLVTDGAVDIVPGVAHAVPLQNG